MAQDSQKMPERIKLMSNDGEIFDVKYKIAVRSGLIKSRYEILGYDEEEDDEPLMLPNVNAATLTLIIQWCTHHKDEPLSPETTKDTRRTDDIAPWDVEFLQLDQHTLFELMNTANYLDIPDLLENICKTVANTIKGKTPEELRKTFNIQYDYEKEEEAHIEKEDAWIEEP